MSRIVKSLALALALTVVAVPAFAEGRQKETQEQRAAHKAEMEKKFPMPAADFRAHVGARQQKARARMEKHIESKKMAADKAAEVRARFDLNVAKVNEKVDAVCADGTVTLAEAKEVHALSKSLHPHHAKKENPA